MADRKIKSNAETNETAMKKSAKELAKAEKAKAKEAKKAKKANTAGFFRSVVAERKKITWYAGKQSFNSTVAVIITMVICAIIIGLVDWILGQGVNFVGTIGEMFR